MKQELVRNFCIIAHIDHGKSTLADRFLQMTGAISERDFRNQVLDDMDLERERGITIKASAVRIQYKAKDGKTYQLNLIDTPGHVDFTYEVSKSIGACEGAILLVDAAQGVEAQTVANLYLAMEHDLVIIPVLNKIDLANAEPERVRDEIHKILNLPKEDIMDVSAKEGTGIAEVLERVLREVPPPSGSADKELQALIFDSSFNTYKGVIIYVRIFNGKVKPGEKIKMLNSGREYEVQEVGVFMPQMEEAKELVCGDVGYLLCNIKEAKQVSVGDTITNAKHPAPTALPGYTKMPPMVFAGIYPVNSKDFAILREAVEKLKLSDASFVFEPESSPSLGFGFRCGFLGLLHMEIVQERLEREFDLNLVVTTPSVVYKIKTTDGEEINVDNPTKLPEITKIEATTEPQVRACIITPAKYLGAIMELSLTRRGAYKSTEYLSADRAQLTYEMPLSEIIIDFYDKIKSITSGYGSLDYEFIGYQPTNLVKLDILLNGDRCDAFSLLIHQDKAYYKGRAITQKLKELVPRQMFEVAIQAAIGGKIIARETVKALKKNVTSKCYGGDITRKRKLWEKQKAGKKRMKQFGKVQIPQEAFIAALKA